MRDDQKCLNKRQITVKKCEKLGLTGKNLENWPHKIEKSSARK